MVNHHEGLQGTRVPPVADAPPLFGRVKGSVVMPRSLTPRSKEGGSYYAIAKRGASPFRLFWACATRAARESGTEVHIGMILGFGLDKNPTNP